MLGHYDAGFTLRTYTHATRQKQDEAAQTMGSFMAQVMWAEKRRKNTGEKAKPPLRYSLNLSAHFRVWVTVWVRATGIVGVGQLAMV